MFSECIYTASESCEHGHSGQAARKSVDSHIDSSKPSPHSAVIRKSSLTIAEIELYRLEQRYTRRKKRANVVSAAQYVDREYICQAKGNMHVIRPVAKPQQAESYRTSRKRPTERGKET